MRCKLVTEEEYYFWYENNKDTPIFNDDDEYVFFKQFGWEVNRDQRRVAIQEYQATLDIKQEKE